MVISNLESLRMCGIIHSDPIHAFVFQNFTFLPLEIRKKRVFMHETPCPHRAMLRPFNIHQTSLTNDTFEIFLPDMLHPFNKPYCDPPKESLTNVLLVTMFVTSEHGIVAQDARPIKDDNCRLLGVRSPHLVVLDSERSTGSKTVRLLLRDFEELGSCDRPTKKAILDFCFYLSVANMDEAFKVRFCFFEWMENFLIL